MMRKKSITCSMSLFIFSFILSSCFYSSGRSADRGLDALSPAEVLREIVLPEIKIKTDNGLFSISSFSFDCHSGTNTYIGYISFRNTIEYEILDDIVDKIGVVVLEPSLSIKIKQKDLSSFEGGSKVLATLIYRACEESGQPVEDVQNIRISWERWDSKFNLKGYIYLDDKGNVIDEKEGEARGYEEWHKQQEEQKHRKQKGSQKAEG